MRLIRQILTAGVVPVFGLTAYLPGAPTPPSAPGLAASGIFHPPIAVVGANQSNNWSGYNQGALEKGTIFQGVAGDWVVPTATDRVSGQPEYSASWVGIGGGCVDSGCTITDSTLIQAGTEQDAGPTGGPAYYAWWEIIPAPSIEITDSSGNPQPVVPGDHIHVAITQSAPEVWSIEVVDSTENWRFQQSVPYSSSYATAEWIEETPVTVSNGGSVSIGPLPNLSQVYFDNATTATSAGGPLGNAGLVPAEELQLVGTNGQVLASPSAPDSDTDGFNVCSYPASGSSCPVPTSS